MFGEPRIAEQLARYPILLDELLTPDTLYTPADKSRLADELRQTLNRLPEDDEEALPEALRVFKHAQMLHVAASDGGYASSDESKRLLNLYRRSYFRRGAGDGVEACHPQARCACGV